MRQGGTAIIEKLNCNIRGEAKEVNVLVTVQGDYGRRILNHLHQQAPASWCIKDTTLPSINLPVIDEPADYLPRGLGQTQLLVHLGESHQAGQLIPALVEETNASAVIAPVDHAHWLPPGLQNQIKKELSRRGVTVVFPQPFCSLTETTFGYSPQVYDDPIISSFARHFGAPRLEVVADKEGLVVSKLEIRRGSPCGSSHYAAKRIQGLPLPGLTPKAGLICLHYPCLASMALEEREGRIETLMHLAGQIFNDSLDAALAKNQDS